MIEENNVATSFQNGNIDSKSKENQDQQR